MQNNCQSDQSCWNDASRCRVREIYEHMHMADAPLAMAYVPTQHWGEIYPACRGLQAGTIFPELCKPFCGRGGAHQ